MTEFGNIPLHIVLCCVATFSFNNNFPTTSATFLKGFSKDRKNNHILEKYWKFSSFVKSLSAKQPYITLIITLITDNTHNRGQS